MSKSNSLTTLSKLQSIVTQGFRQSHRKKSDASERPSGQQDFRSAKKTTQWFSLRLQWCFFRAQVDCGSGFFRQCFSFSQCNAFLLQCKCYCISLNAMLFLSFCNAFLSLNGFPFACNDILSSPRWIMALLKRNHKKKNDASERPPGRRETLNVCHFFRGL